MYSCGQHRTDQVGADRDSPSCVSSPLRVLCLHMRNLVGHDCIYFATAKMIDERTAEHDTTVSTRRRRGTLRAIIRQDINMLEQYAGLLAQVIDPGAQFAARKLV